VLRTACVVLSGALFAWFETTRSGHLAYSWGISYLQWPIRSLLAHEPVLLLPVAHAADLEDLFTLPALQELAVGAHLRDSGTS
jgi:hypothetical protein